MNRPTIEKITQELASLYDKPFGGKSAGRYRISRKMLCKIAGRKRLPESFLQELMDEMYELGFVLLTMETYYVVASIRTFENYRRLGESSFETVSGKEKAEQTKH